MKYVCSLVVVSDINRSRKFYEEVMGQTVESDFGENVFFAGGFAIHQKEHFESLVENREIRQKSNSFELYFEDDKLADLLQKVKELKLEFVHEIVEQPWKQQVIRFYDYDKNMIEVGERMEHVAFRLSQENYPLEEICDITYLDEDAVLRAIDEYTHLRQ